MEPPVETANLVNLDLPGQLATKSREHMLLEESLKLRMGRPATSARALLCSFPEVSRELPIGFRSIFKARMHGAHDHPVSQYGESKIQA